MRHHHAGMHAGICTSGSRRVDIVPKERREGMVKHALYALRIGLYLPPMVAGAVKGECDEVAHGTKKGEDSPQGKTKLI